MLNVVDVVVFCILAVFFVKHCKSGFLSQILSWGALIVGFWIAFCWHGVVAEFLFVVSDDLWDSRINLVIAFLLLLVGVNYGVHKAGLLLRKSLETLYLMPLDRLLGGLLGLLKACVMLFIVAFLGVYFQISILETKLSKSLSGVFLLNQVQKAMRFIDLKSKKLFSIHNSRNGRFSSLLMISLNLGCLLIPKMNVQCQIVYVTSFLIF